MSSCELCGKEFKFPYLLLRHLNKKYPCSSNKFSVENCEKVKKNCLEIKENCQDIKNHCQEIKRFECTRCKKVLKSKRSLKYHSKICNGVNSLTCPTCLKVFSSCPSKNQHIKNVKCTPPEDISEPHKNSVYLLIEREFMASKQNIFKIGRSVNVCNRTKRYPKGSQLLVVLPCIDSCVSECNIQKVFSEKFIQRKDIGSEYYEGPPNAIIKEFINNVDPHF